MDGYTLTRKWFDFVFENPDKITTSQIALYGWLVECCNRKGFPEKFPFNTDDACIAMGVQNAKTVWKAMNELVELGFVKMVHKSMNQHKPSVIGLTINKVKTNGCLDKVIVYSSNKRITTETASGLAGDEQRITTETASGYSYKPRNKETKKDIVDFSMFWKKYDKSNGKKKAEEYWNKLTEEEKKLAFDYLDTYRRKQPDSKFRKDAERYIKYELWIDQDNSGDLQEKEPERTSDDEYYRLMGEYLRPSNMQIVNGLQLFE